MTPTTDIVIHPADEKNLDRIVEMGVNFLSKPPYVDLIKFDINMLRATAAALLNSPDDATIIIADLDGVPVGMLGLKVYMHPLSGRHVCGEIFWWVEPGFRGVGLRILRAGERWARSKGATVMNMIAPTPEVERLYDAIGYGRIEVNYQKTL